MPYRDLRQYLSALESRGLLRWIDEKVDKNWEISCIARLVFRGLPPEKRFAIGFRNIEGYEGMSIVVGALGASLNVIATALETEPDPIRIQEKLARVRYPMEPVIVDKGPCKEVILKGDEVDVNKFPVPVWTPERDPGPYLTPLWVTKDPETGVRNVGMYRAQIKGKDKVGIQFGTPDKHGAIHISKWWRLNKPAPAAIIVGLDPVLYVTGVSRYEYGLDEFAAAGGIRGEPVELVRCETIDIEVPATAEIVIEGEFLPNEMEVEGPFGEYTGYMCEAHPQPVLHVKCITHRRNPILQGVLSQLPPSESSMIRGTFHEGSLLKHLKYDLKIPGIIDVHIVEASGSLAMIWVRMRKEYPGHVDQVASAIMGYFGMSHVKWIVLTDEDVNIRDPFAREWVLSFRVRPDKDIRVISDTCYLTLDPSAAPPEVPKWERRGAKIIIDATKKWKYPEIALPPKKYLDAAREKWPKYGLPSLERFELPVEIK
jgi:UbiD family decarboxylase